jgi:hypothetical protein
VVYTLAQLRQFAEGAGFSGSSADTAAAIAMAESGGDPYAINYADPGGSYGLTQINGAAHGATAANTLGNPSEAFAQMFSISNGGTNFSPWSTFNSGAYLPFLSQLGGGSGDQTFGIGAAPGGDPLGGSSGSFSGQTATGQATSSQSPLSAIFSAVQTMFQTGGIMLLGAVLIAIGAWYLARPASKAAA